MICLRGVAALFILMMAAPLLNAGLLPGNLWPNPTLESDPNHDGSPDFWNKGGSDTTIDLWTSSLSVSPTHSFQLNDASASNYGEWYSDLLGVNHNAIYQLRYNLRYIVTNVAPMRVTVNFYDASSSYLSGLSYTFSGAHDYWEEITQTFTTPNTAAKIGLSFTSGGGANVTGRAWLDDISLALSTNGNSLIPYVESFPTLPNPLVIRDWKKTATDYHLLAFNPSVSGPQLPLLYQVLAHYIRGIFRSGVRFAELRGQHTR